MRHYSWVLLFAIAFLTLGLNGAYAAGGAGKGDQDPITTVFPPWNPEDCDADSALVWDRDDPHKSVRCDKVLKVPPNVGDPVVAKTTTIHDEDLWNENIREVADRQSDLEKKNHILTHCIMPKGLAMDVFLKRIESSCRTYFCQAEMRPYPVVLTTMLGACQSPSTMCKHHPVGSKHAHIGCMATLPKKF